MIENILTQGTDIKMEEKKKMMPKEDIALYRLLAIILFGVAVFVFACFIGDAGMWTFFSSTVTKIILITLFAVVAFFAVRGIIVGNPDNKVFTIGSVCCVMAPVLLVLAFFHFFGTCRGDLLKIVAIATTIVAFVKVVYPSNYFKITLVAACAFVAMFFMQLPGVPSKFFMNIVFKILAWPLGIVLPLCVLVLMFLAKKNKGKFKLGKVVDVDISKNNDISFWGAVVLMTVAIVGTVILAIVPAIYLIVMGVYLGLFIIVGVICTIKLV
ncbi:MAG: hypothetical protein K6F14_04545 [Clostridiales bacterium]|nr:hypothetical protein [Clostridiales bacterium]